MLKKIIKLMAVIVAFSFMAGCGKKTSEPAMTHHEFGSVTLMFSQLYEECMANNDTQGAQDAVETYRYLGAFYCNRVYYEDVKNRNYNNIDYDIGELQIAVAAYNEYNDESAIDVEVDWICQFSSCTKEQHDAVDAYVEWFYEGQYVTADGLIRDYENELEKKYAEIRRSYDITDAPAHRELTPAQFQEVQKYIKDPSYQVDTTVWD